MSQIPGFRNVSYTGVIYVMQRAMQLGYSKTDMQWANLGQGSPETGVLPEAPERLQEFSILPHHNEYSPVAGEWELRQKIADYYNNVYRLGHSSLYTPENVSISGGGRIALTRIVASMGQINLGHFLPDYTAYEELLHIFKSFTPIPIIRDYKMGELETLDYFKNEISSRGLTALLMSNPCNPTGQVIQGEQLKGLHALACEYQCSLIMDEFYSHYLYQPVTQASIPAISIAEFVNDVDADPVIILDGVTKNWRYPGWRLSWTIGPKEVISAIESSGSFLDGGANHPLQKEVLQLLNPEHALQETLAIQSCFAAKRELMIKRLRKMGIKVEMEPQGTFYIWANLSELPAPLNDGFAFFEAGLREKVITVPGIFFDVNPGKRRNTARFSQYSRISFGADMETVEKGLDALERVISNGG